MPKAPKGRQPKRFDVHRTLQSADRKYRAPRSSELKTPPLSEDEAKKKKKFRLTWKKTLLLIFVIVLVPVLYFGIWDYHNFSGASKKMFGSGYILTALPPNNLKNTSGRTNILIAGFSTDDPGHDGAKLTDSIMIMSLDKDSKTGYMLSIPRDLYVDIPDFGTHRINEVYQDGETSKFHEKGYAKGGMGLLEKVVARDFGLKLHYFALINYGAVKDTVKALHGITVTIDSRDPRGIYDPGFLAKEGSKLRLKNGRQHINAQQALNLTRARGKAYGSYGLELSDFDRAKNQRAVIKGIKDKLTLKLLLDPRKNEPILNAFADNIKTDLGLNNILPFYKLFNSVPDNKLKSVGLRDEKKKINLLTGQTINGQDVLVPLGGINDYSQIKALVKKLNQ